MQLLTASATSLLRGRAARHYLSKHHTGTYNLKDMREMMSVGDFGDALLYIKFEVQKFEVKQSLKSYWKK